MSLIWLILAAMILYVAMQYLQTFRSMVQELNNMRSQCMNGGGGGGVGSVGSVGGGVVRRWDSDAEIGSGTAAFTGSMNDLKKTLLTALTQMKSNA
jgi:hypothetical protein